MRKQVSKEKETINHPEYGEIKRVRVKYDDGTEKEYYIGKQTMTRGDFAWSMLNEGMDSVITQTCTVCGAENRTEPDGRLAWCEVCDMLTVHDGLSQMF